MEAKNCHSLVLNKTFDLMRATSIKSLNLMLSGLGFRWERRVHFWEKIVISRELELLLLLMMNEILIIGVYGIID